MVKSDKIVNGVVVGLLVAVLIVVVVMCVVNKKEKFAEGFKQLMNVNKSKRYPH